MTSVGSFEAKTHLPQLLERVARGETFLITRRGKPAALLTPPPQGGGEDVKQVVREMQEWQEREGPTLGPGLTVRDLREEGRRF
jgi:prevent-host-death family protein